jgi:hypothetical protein
VDPETARNRITVYDGGRLGLVLPRGEMIDAMVGDPYAGRYREHVLDTMKAVQSAERKACAALADSKAASWAALARSDVLNRPQPPVTPRELVEARLVEALDLAAAIRARGDA